MISVFGQIQDFFFGISIYYLLLGAEHLSSRYASSNAEILRIIKQLILFSLYTLTHRHMHL